MAVFAASAGEHTFEKRQLPQISTVRQRYRLNLWLLSRCLQFEREDNYSAKKRGCVEGQRGGCTARENFSMAKMQADVVCSASLGRVVEPHRMCSQFLPIDRSLSPALCVLGLFWGIYVLSEMNVLRTTHTDIVLSTFPLGKSLSSSHLCISR